MCRNPRACIEVYYMCATLLCIDADVFVRLGGVYVGGSDVVCRNCVV